MKYFGLISCLFLILCFSCNKDSEITTIIEENIPPQTIFEVSELITTLTGATSKTWKISEAKLVRDNDTLDISDNFNVEDDEFIFSTDKNNTQLEWRRGHSINTNATTVSETLLDYYLSPKLSDIQLKADSNELFTIDGALNFQVTDNIPSGILYNEDSTQIHFTLIEKEPEDYFTPPTNLEFSEVVSFTSNVIDGGAPGMIGSYSDNSMFVVTRKNKEDGTAKAEIIHKFDLTNNDQSESLLEYESFVSKQLHIVNNQLIVVGAEHINTYNIDFSSTPDSIRHGKAFTRFGMAVQDDDIYIIGGEIRSYKEAITDTSNNGISNDRANKIYKWNLQTKTLTEFATLPEPKFGARATIINDKLYIFGGSTEFVGEPETHSKDILVLPLSDRENWQIFDMGQPMQSTFVNKYQNLIFVAGKSRFYSNENGNSSVSFLGVFDTNTNKYSIIKNNLDLYKAVERDAIQQMCLFNDKMYVIYGSGYVPDNPIEQEMEWKIYAADLY